MATAAWLRRSVLGIAAVTGHACAPYDPPLPPAPFLCGDREPRCPEGYHCVEDPDGKQVCRADGTVPDAGLADAMPGARAAGPDVR